MEKFIPQKAKTATEMYKGCLLNGDALRIDAGGHNSIDLIPRSDINNWNTMHNVGYGNFKELPRYAEEFRTVISELKAEGYIVVKKRCTNSGCCQYAASIYYLA